MITLVQGGGTAEVNAAVEAAHRAFQTDWRWRTPAERRASTYHEPVGVVGEIIPFNWSPIHAGGKMAPTLAAGNTVVIKPSEQDPLTVMRIVELLNTVLPQDVLHAVPGTGSKAGQPLTAHPLVRTITFTGSTGAGAAVTATAAKNITPALLELSGKNAMIVFDDADFGSGSGVTHDRSSIL